MMLKKKIYLITVILLITSITYVRGNEPEWITNPYAKFPSSQYLCAVGTAYDLKTAQNEALKNIAGFFETRVKAVTKSMEREVDTSISSQISSSISSSVNAVSEASLKFTEVKETWQDPKTKLYYVYVVLDKKAALAYYEKEIMESEAFISSCLFKTEDPLIRFAKLNRAIDKYYSTQNAFLYHNALMGESASFLRPAFSVQELLELRADAAREIPIRIMVQGDSSVFLKSSLINVINQLGFNQLVNDEDAEFQILALLESEPPKTLANQVFQPLRLNISFQRGDTLLFSFVDKTEQGGINIEEATSWGIKVLSKNIEKKFNQEFGKYLSNLE